MLMSVLLVCMSVYQVPAWYPQWSAVRGQRVPDPLEHKL